MELLFRIIDMFRGFGKGLKYVIRKILWNCLLGDFMKKVKLMCYI